MENEYYYESSAALPSWFIPFMLCVFVFYVICMWRIFTKAGRPGWEAIIPIYNYYIMLKIVGKPGWWLIMLFIPILNLVFSIWAVNMLSKSFGKDEGFTIGLLLLGFIFYPILAFGPAKYRGPYGNPELYRAYQEEHKFDFENKA